VEENEIEMTRRNVERILEGLLQSIRDGVQEAQTAHMELSSEFNVWKDKPTSDNWHDVEYAAQGAMMWLPRRWDTN
jgi:hypothetical protein